MIIFFSGGNCYPSGEEQFVIKLQEFMADDLVQEGDEGRGKLR